MCWRPLPPGSLVHQAHRPHLPLIKDYLGQRGDSVGLVTQTRAGDGKRENVGSEKMDESLMSPFPTLSWKQPLGTQGRPVECPLLPRMPGAKSVAPFVERGL